MKTVKELISEITQLIIHIKNDYPTLYKYLDEDPMTIPNMEHPKISIVELENYLESLKDLLDKKKPPII